MSSDTHVCGHPFAMICVQLCRHFDIVLAFLLLDPDSKATHSIFSSE